MVLFLCFATQVKMRAHSIKSSRGTYLPLFWIEGQEIFVFLLISDAQIIDYFVR